MTLRATIQKILIHDEGFKSKVYQDSRGYWTIGVGHNLGKKLESITLSNQIVLAILAEDVRIATESLYSIFSESEIANWKPARRDALISLMFNVGEMGFRTFVKMIRAIKASDWELAAKELADSRWAGQVDPRNLAGEGRDDRLVYMLKSGDYHEAYSISRIDTLL